MMNLDLLFIIKEMIKIIMKKLVKSQKKGTFFIVKRMFKKCGINFMMSV